MVQSHWEANKSILCRFICLVCFHTYSSVISLVPQVLSSSRSLALSLSLLATSLPLCKQTSKQASHEASFLPSKQVVEALLACLLVGLVGWRFRRRIAGSMAKIANNKVHRYVAWFLLFFVHYIYIKDCALERGTSEGN